MENIRQLSAHFKKPPQEYRSTPFWSWNADLQPDELARQVRDMKMHGMGGFFMHSREGLETGYLGDRFMECIKETVKAARENGMQAWLYDEDRYSSGMGGSLVPKAGGDEVRAKALVLDASKERIDYDENLVAFFKAEIDGRNIRKLERISTGKPGQGIVDENSGLDGSWLLLTFKKVISAPSEWCQNDTYVDLLNPETIRVFLETTHEKYKQYAGDEFGKTIPGIFTDEPSVSGFTPHSRDMLWLPWSDSFAGYFLEKRGYDFLDFVPYMFFDGEQSFKVRHDFWRTITERFCEVYSMRIGEWCRDNDLKFTGHFHSEAGIAAAARTSGAVMPHYRYYHVPGVDTLCEQTSENITIKQCSSVANQYGKKRVLSETFGVTGWDFTFEGMKWLIDWQYALGVNALCQHLAQYTLKGCRKRDYPPSFNYNNCWWKYYPLIEEYASRLGMVLAQGSAVRDVLVLHPASTVWGLLGADDTHEAENYSIEFSSFVDLMLMEHYDFDLGDETIMEESGRIDNGRFYINTAGYSVVVVPPVKTLFGNTVRLLKEFLENGGKVISAGPAPAMIEGAVSDAAAELYGHKNLYTAKSVDAAVKMLESILPRKVGIRDGKGREAEKFYYMYREMDDGYALFIVNNDRRQKHDVRVSISSCGKIEEWDLLTGTVMEREGEISESGMQFEESFKPAASKLYMIHTGERLELTGQETKELFLRNRASGEKGHIAAVLDHINSITRTMPNALVLDRCAFRIGDGGWSEDMEVWKAQREIRKALGMKQVYKNGILQRHHWIDAPHPGDGTAVELRFSVHIADLPANEVFLVMEEADRFTVKVNGFVTDSITDGWYLDRSMRKLKLGYLKPGNNEIILAAAYLNRMEIEDCFIIGDFGVDDGRSIVKEPGTLEFGDWCRQGYLHYCGSLVYHFNFDYTGQTDEKIVLELGEYCAVTVEIRVNGATAGHIPWQAANGLDISGFLKQGENRIEIEVMGSPRNLLGPLHQVQADNSWIDSRSFRREGAQYTPEYVTRPYGLMGAVHLLSKTRRVEIAYE